MLSYIITGVIYVLIAVACCITFNPKPEHQENDFDESDIYID